eukprot:8799114-Lingulodinium_polyedra.AAC.1
MAGGRFRLFRWPLGHWRISSGNQSAVFRSWASWRPLRLLFAAVPWARQACGRVKAAVPPDL